MGALSNQMLVVTILLYVFAMLAYAIEYAFGGSSVVARAATRQLVGAGAPVEVTAEGADATEPPRFAARAGRIGLVLNVAGAAAHATVLITRASQAGRAPWGNMYEFVVMATMVGMIAWLAVLTRWRSLRHLGVFPALVASILLGVAGMVLYVPAGPLVPALHSYWLVIHVGAASIASGVFLVGFVAAALHLSRLGYDQGKRSFPYTLGSRLPQAGVLERLTFRVHAFGFPIWTFGVICGAIWAEASWGRYWNWDPKETWSFVAWVVYACYLHARSTPSVSRQVTSWIAVVGWITMLINLFAVNLFANGLHSYAGI
jgi:cytochrome c-type biogenesis protein CcsB